jgi:hypothetical protein
MKDTLESYMLAAVFTILLVDIFPTFPWVDVAVGLTVFYFGFKLLLVLDHLARRRT